MKHMMRQQSKQQAQPGVKILNALFSHPAFHDELGFG